MFFFWFYIDLKEKFEGLSTINEPFGIPIFSASRAVQRLSGGPATFLRLDIKTNDAHGSFDKQNGTFVAKTAGTYRLHFNGASFSPTGRSEVHLCVNTICQANAMCFHEAKTSSLYGSLVISTLLELKSGDSVDIFVREGALFEEDGSCFNRFSAFLLP